MASGDRIRNLNLNLKASSLIAPMGTMFILRMASLGLISVGFARREYEELHTNTVDPSRPMTQSSLIPE
jgi:hypothetical protein